MDLDDWNWTVGVVVAPFGTKGEMKVRLETDFPDRFKDLKEVCVRRPKGAADLLPVEATRLHKGQLLLKLKAIDSIEQVETLRHARIQIKRSEAVLLPKDSYYAADLIGFDVRTVDGRELGKLDRVVPNPGHDLWAVGDALIPAVKQIVTDVDTAARRIVVDPPQGMLPGEEPEDAD